MIIGYETGVVDVQTGNGERIFGNDNIKKVVRLRWSVDVLSQSKRVEHALEVIISVVCVRSGTVHITAQSKSYVRIDANNRNKFGEFVEKDCSR